jgi:invasion protein IalB
MIMAPAIETPRRSGIARTGLGLLAALTLATMACSARAAEVKATEKVYKDWHVSCATGHPCVAYVVGSGTQMILGIPDDKGNNRAVLRLAPAAKVGAPVTVRLNSGWTAQLRVAVCTKAYCEAPVPVASTAKFVAPLRSDSGGVVAYQAGEVIVIARFSLAGVSAALQNIKM